MLAPMVDPNDALSTQLKEKSFENMINFYSEELNRILSGASPAEVLGFCERRKFRRLGVFKGHRRSYELSEKTMTILRRKRSYKKLDTR
jgi:regulator of sirC expression with transglutaminase-like and TPR domain